MPGRSDSLKIGKCSPSHASIRRHDWATGAGGLAWSFLMVIMNQPFWASSLRELGVAGHVGVWRLRLHLL
jgi:hypothetical protein